MPLAARWFRQAGALFRSLATPAAVPPEQVCLGIVRETDTIARLGGDEFAIVQVALADPADATTLAVRVVDEISRPYDVDGHHLIIGTSVGIAMGPTDGDQADVLLRSADLALYRAKADGRGTFHFFETEMDAQMQERLALERDLRSALARGEFELHYQPIVDVASRHITGFEALVRWRHPERGLIPPNLFVPLAEEIGAIVPIGAWIIRQACETAAGWPDDIVVSVNLSPVQFGSPGLVSSIQTALSATGLDPARLELEITEITLL